MQTTFVNQNVLRSALLTLRRGQRDNSLINDGLDYLFLLLLCPIFCSPHWHHYSRFKELLSITNVFRTITLSFAILMNNFAWYEILEMSLHRIRLEHYIRRQRFVIFRRQTVIILTIRFSTLSLTGNFLFIFAVCCENEILPCFM